MDNTANRAASPMEHADKLIRASQQGKASKDKIKTCSEREWKRTEGRRHQIVLRNRDHLHGTAAAPTYVESPETQVAQNDTLRKAVGELYRHFKHDRIVTALLDTVLLGDIEFGDEQDLVKALKITLAQVHSAKKKLKYFAKSSMTIELN
jgi:hypothetical protein